MAAPGDACFAEGQEYLNFRAKLEDLVADVLAATSVSDPEIAFRIDGGTVREGEAFTTPFRDQLSSLVELQNRVFGAARQEFSRPR